TPWSRRPRASKTNGAPVRDGHRTRSGPFTTDSPSYGEVASQLAALRNGSHSLNRHPLPRRIWAVIVHFGRNGRRASRMLASSGVFQPLRRLQSRHAVTRFSQVSSPPRERGTTWSMFSSRRGGRLPQYWH